jgi:hypothetical protein
MSYMTEFVVSFILLSDTVLQCHYITEDNNRVNIDPDKLRNGSDHYTSSSDKAELYKFLARYVRKVYPDTDIQKDLKNNEGFLFIDRITPSDIAFVMYTKEWLQRLGPNYKNETVGCGGAWRNGNKIMTIVYWRERKEKRARYESME